MAAVLVGPAGQVGAAGNQASPAFVGEIRPSPLDKNQQAVAKADEKKNVDEGWVRRCFHSLQTCSLPVPKSITRSVFGGLEPVVRGQAGF